MTTPEETDLIDLIPPEAELVRRIVDEVRRYPRIRRPLLRFLTADDFDELIAATRENTDNINLILERMGVIEQAVQVIPELVTRVGSLEGQMESFGGRMESFEGQMESFGGRMESFEGRMESFEGRMESFEGRMESVEGRMESVEGRLGSVEGRLESVEGRMESVEGRLTSVEGTLGQVVQNVQSLQGDVRSLRGSVGQLRGDSYESTCAGEIDGILDGYLEFAVLADRENIRLSFLDARRNGQISREEFLDGQRADIIARAMHDAEQRENLAVVEASITCNRADLEAASRRAALIGGVTGIPTAAYLVTHHEWPAEIDGAARDLGVTIIRNEHPQYANDA